MRKIMSLPTRSRSEHDVKENTVVIVASSISNE